MGFENTACAPKAAVHHRRYTPGCRTDNAPRATGAPRLYTSSGWSSYRSFNHLHRVGEVAVVQVQLHAVHMRGRGTGGRCGSC